ncbi:TPA: heat-stable enterotoxin EAST1 [Escherichia coli]
MPSTQYIRRLASSYASCIWCATACASCHGMTTKQSLVVNHKIRTPG